jgi:glycosyltransferase involved in cell wall biosynthesis
METFMSQLTVAICTYNGESRLSEVLECLLAQTQVDHVSWDVLVVDNNSSDGTVRVVQHYQSIWPSGCPLRYVFESVQGLAAARQRAIEAATSQWVGFLDDDNLPSPHWVAAAIAFSHKTSKLGAYSGIIHPKLDVPAPPYFEQIKSLLAVNHPGDEAFCYNRAAKPRRVPAGAGCVVRKHAWLESVPPQLFCQGRSEKRSKTIVGCGEDTEAFYHLQNAGWELWHNPAMEIEHHLETRRLEPKYLLKLARGFGYANYIFRLTRLYPWQRPFLKLMLPAYIVSDGIKLITHYLRYHHQYENDITIACEFQARMGRFLSSFMS